MMKQLYLTSTALFGAGLLAFWAAAGGAGSGDAESSASASSAEPSAASGPPRFTLTEVAAHAQPSDCWMAIDGGVFDLSAYVVQHPAPPSVLASWCGKEATRAYQTKDRGRPHSSYASQLLEQYRIGSLAESDPR